MIDYETTHRHPDLPRYKALERPRPADVGGAADARAERQLAMLGELAEMAMDLARSAYRRVKAQEAALEAAAEAEAEAGAAAPAAAARAEAEAEAAAGPGDRTEDRIEALKGALEGAASGGVSGCGIATSADPSLVFARLSGVVFRALAMEKQIAETAEAEDAADPFDDPEMTPERKARIMARWQLLLSRKNIVVKILKTAIVAERPDVDAEECGRQLNDKLLEFERSEVLNRTIWENVMRHAGPLGLHPKWEDWAHEPWAIAEKDGELEWNRNPYPGGP